MRLAKKETALRPEYHYSVNLLTTDTEAEQAESRLAPERRRSSDVLSTVACTTTTSLLELRLVSDA